jgi:adenylylsulfate kinase
MFDWKKPTAMMLGRYQPFHDGHLELFRQTLARTGQVLIAVRDTGGTDDKNPFDFDFVQDQIRSKLSVYEGQYEIVLLPNITNICYGRDVGYAIERINLEPEVEAISATNIRRAMGAG